MRLYTSLRLVRKTVFAPGVRFESVLPSHHGSKIRFAPLTSSLPEICALDKSLTNRNAIHRYSLDQTDKFWKTLAKSRLDWYSDFHTVQNCDMKKGKFEWFAGGKLNASVNCVDRHAKADPNRVALIWERDEAGTEVRITYKELLYTVCRTSNWLRAQGVGKGDRVVLYLPMSPTAVATMLACARIGAVHSVVFAGFSAEALAARIQDAGAKVVVTADQGLRAGKRIELKKTVDDALAKCPDVKSVLVMRRTGANVPMKTGRDVYLDTELEKQSDWCEPAVLDSEDALFMLYTSGSTGKPKGIVHTQAGYLLYAAVTHQLVFDVKPGDVFGCVADVGWITGHTYGVYGPLCNGVTSVLFESIPTYPDPGRYWEMVQRLKITQFYGSPTAIRTLIRFGDEWPRKYDLSSVRTLGSVGEPINHEAWQWFHDVVGQKRCSLVDTWWQTETGGIVIAPGPADPGAEVKPTIAMRPFFGQQPVLMDEKGKPMVDVVDANGALCLGRAWPGIARTIHGDHQRFIDTYFKQYPGYYFTGDGAHVYSDGYFGITGRMDDVINVSGHRLGTAEIEDVIDGHDDVAESAVVPFPHAIKGEGIFAFVDIKEAAKHRQDDIIDSLKQQIKKSIASYAVPDYFLITPSGGLPKTRSGKIMRRLLKKIASNQGDDLGDTSTLSDPSVVDDILKQFAEKIGRVETGKKA